LEQRLLAGKASATENAPPQQVISSFFLPQDVGFPMNFALK
jgi:hypothetical protein